MKKHNEWAIAVVIAVLPFTAYGADDVDALGGKVLELDARVHDLDSQLKPPKDLVGGDVADRRLIDAQVLYELKNYEAAAIILLDLVDKYPTSAAYPEALFYLADSLFQKRDFLSSRRYFEKIVEQGPSNQRYQEALQKLVELALHTGDYSAVEAIIAKLETLPADRQLPAVPYVKGKYYFFRQQYGKAVEALRSVSPTSPHYTKALYFTGAANVGQGGDHLVDALTAFNTILKTEAKTDDQKKIAELSHLAVARINLERGQFSSALDEYSQISHKSAFFNDSLYESAWVSIRAKDYTKAERALDILLLNAPDSPLTPEVKLLVGGLHIRLDQYGPAQDAFTSTHDEFEPVYKLLEDQLTKNGDPNVYFRTQIANNLSRFDAATFLPAPVAKWVKNEPEVLHITSLLNDERDLKKSLDEADEIVKRLEKALGGPGRVNVFPELAAARTHATELVNELTLVKKQLSNKESQLIGPVAGAEKSQIEQLTAERSELETKLAVLPTSAESIEDRQRKARAAFNEVDKRAVELMAELAGIRASAVATDKFYRDQVAKTLDNEQKTSAEHELTSMASEIDTWQLSIDGLRKELEEATSSVGVDDADMQMAAQLKAQYDDVVKRLHAVSVEVLSRLGGAERTKAEQIASILERTHGVEERIAAFNARIENLLDSRIGDIQSTINDEKTKVVAFRDQLNSYRGDSADVGGAVLANSFKTVSNRFYNIVVRSDVGIIDVAWALKDSATRDTNRLVSERKRELKLLDDEFKEVLKEQP